ncbi:MAG TPA: histidine phosphatase family protein [Isosphaeraceae bacterium]|nr:histidine phosphatase family protein [Isosphaeraceae bacterium]
MCQVVLIRPGATIYDEQKRVQGILDIPLSERGQSEVGRMAEDLAHSLGDSALSALYCGPGEHVVKSAEIVGRVLGVRPKRIDEFRNLDQGLWQGLQIDEIKRRNTKLFRQWIDDPETICPPQGETFEGAMERIKTGFKPLWRRHQDESIGLVVGEPLARMVGCYLRREPRVQLDEQWSCCRFELISIAPVLLRNGTA